LIEDSKQNNSRYKSKNDINKTIEIINKDPISESVDNLSNVTVNSDFETIIRSKNHFKKLLSSNEFLKKDEIDQISIH